MVTDGSVCISLVQPHAPSRLALNKYQSVSNFMAYLTSLLCITDSVIIMKDSVRALAFLSTCKCDMKLVCSVSATCACLLLAYNYSYSLTTDN